MAALVTPKKWHFVVLLAMIGSLVFLFFHNRQWPDTTVVAGGHELSVLVADTFARQHEGWSNKADMGGKDGMLFVFGYNASQAMVMRDMQFPLDMVWVNNGQIVDMQLNIPPEPGVSEASLTSYQSKVPAAAVLELKAGLVSQLDLHIGDPVTVLDN